LRAASAGLAVLAASAWLGACQSCVPPSKPGEQHMCRSQLDACSRKPAPSFSVDTLQLIPDTVAAGGSTTRRIVYTYCPPVHGRIQRGTMQTTVSFQDRRLGTDRHRGFPLLPGQYTYDAEINIPRGAKPGVYMLETRLDGVRDATFKRYQVFKVAP
jgi:hypothetical protein